MKSSETDRKPVENNTTILTGPQTLYEVTMWPSVKAV